MQVRYVLALAALAAVAVAVMFAFLGRRFGPDDPRRQHSRRLRAPSMAMRSMPPAVVPDAAMIGRFLAAGGQPRLIANLADRVGDIVVSVRQVYASDRVRNLFEESAKPGAIGAWQLILQTNGVQGPSAASEWNIDVSSVRARDNLNTIMHPVEPSMPLHGAAPTPNGRTHTVFLSAPNPAATAITEITGALTRRGAANGSDERKFMIRNVPLPNAPRLFGEITLFTLDPNRASKVPSAGLLVGDDMEKALSGALQDASSANLPYLRMVLPTNARTSLNALFPAGVPPIGLSVQPEDNGNIVVEAGIGSTALRRRVWDREPFLIVLQHRALPNALGLQMQVSRGNETVLLPAARAVFPVQGRAPAGSIVVRFRALSRPIGPATVPVSVSRFDGSRWSSEETTEAPIRPNGEAVIGNLRPGRYRLRFHADRMSPLGAVRGIDIRQYLRDRYGIDDAQWSSSVSQEVTVMPGGRAYGAVVEASAKADR